MCLFDVVDDCSVGNLDVDTTSMLIPFGNYLGLLLSGAPDWFTRENRSGKVTVDKKSQKIDADTLGSDPRASASAIIFRSARFSLDLTTILMLLWLSFAMSQAVRISADGTAIRGFGDRFGCSGLRTHSSLYKIRWKWLVSR